MGESAKHLELVTHIIAYIKKKYVGLDCVVTLHDLPGMIGCDKPPKIGQFRPDVYAINAPLTRTIIGEAKTHTDLETNHTQAQFQAFIRFLRLQPNSVFILAVPWQARVRGRTLLLTAQQELNASGVDIVVIDDVRGGA